MYHVDYCKREDGIVSKTTIKRGVGKFAIKLPDDWEMPATTSGKIYRFKILIQNIRPFFIIIQKLIFTKIKKMLYLFTVNARPLIIV